MISIIVSSRSKGQFETLAKNIGETIGAQHEIVRVENSLGSLSISQAYNKGASESRYPFLCFVHEDVRFKTNGWGINIVTHFLNDSSIGLIGVAGGIYKKKMLGGWAEFETDKINIKRINLIQYYKFTTREAEHLLENPEHEIRARVATLDGVLLCTKKIIWESNRFDEKLLKGFHGYDLDFSLQIAQTQKLFVIYDVLIEHFSEGNCDINWYSDMLAVHRKWRKKLPLAIDPTLAASVDIYNADWNKLNYIIRLYIKEGFTYSTLFRVYIALFSLISYSGKKHAILKDFLIQWLHISKLFFRSR